MAERQAAHRQGIENRVIDSSIAREKWGQVIGAGLYVTTVASGTLLILKGYDASGLAAIIGATVAAVSVFVVGKRKRTSELAQKDAANPPRQRVVCNWTHSTLGPQGSASACIAQALIRDTARHWTRGPRAARV